MPVAASGTVGQSMVALSWSWAAEAKGDAPKSAMASTKKSDRRTLGIKPAAKDRGQACKLHMRGNRPWQVTKMFAADGPNLTFIAPADPRRQSGYEKPGTSLLGLLLKRMAYGGETGIRTLGTRKGSTVFETAPIDHSGISPQD